MNLHRPPLLAVAPEGDSAGTWVDVGARQLRVVGGGEVLLRVDFRANVFERDFPSGVRQRARQPVGTFVTELMIPLSSAKRRRSGRDEPASGEAVV